MLVYIQDGLGFICLGQGEGIIVVDFIRLSFT